MAAAEDLDARSLLDQTDIIEVNYLSTKLLFLKCRLLICDIMGVFG